MTKTDYIGSKYYETLGKRIEEIIMKEEVPIYLPRNKLTSFKVVPRACFCCSGKESKITENEQVYELNLDKPGFAYIKASCIDEYR
jgi:hypothetical protein